MCTENREKLVYPIPVSDLLYVGPESTAKFNRYGIMTIGDLDKNRLKDVCRILRNKTDEYLWAMAVGQDHTTVASIESVDDIQSLGNSNTMPRDLVSDYDVKAVFYMLGERVSEGMRDSGFVTPTSKSQ